MNNRRLWLVALGTAIPVITLGAFLDVYLLGAHSFWEYVFVCAWEYTIFWNGIWIGIYINKRTQVKSNG